MTPENFSIYKWRIQLREKIKRAWVMKKMKASRSWRRVQGCAVRGVWKPRGGPECAQFNTRLGRSLQQRCFSGGQGGRSTLPGGFRGLEDEEGFAGQRRGGMGSARGKTRRRGTGMQRGAERTVDLCLHPRVGTCDQK